MKIYDCVVWQSMDKSNDRPLHTVAKQGITELEVTLLRAIHGYARVQEVKQVGEIEREDRQEMLRLCRRYGDVGGIYAEAGQQLIKRVFNVDLHEFGTWLADEIEREEQEREERLRESQRRFNVETARAAAAAAQANMNQLQQQPPQPAPPARRPSAEVVLNKQPEPEPEPVAPEMD